MDLCISLNTCIIAHMVLIWIFMKYTFIYWISYSLCSCLPWVHTFIFAVMRLSGCCGNSINSSRTSTVDWCKQCSIIVLWSLVASCPGLPSHLSLCIYTLWAMVVIEACHWHPIPVSISKAAGSSSNTWGMRPGILWMPNHILPHTWMPEPNGFYGQPFQTHFHERKVYHDLSYLKYIPVGSVDN